MNIKPKRKINFNQPRFIFPLIVFLPLTFLAYELCELFSPDAPVSRVNELNVSLPEAQDKGTLDKVRAMERIRLQDEENITGIMNLGAEMPDTARERELYSDDEVERINRANAERKRMDDELAKLQKSLESSARRINGGAGSQPSPATATPPTASRRSQPSSVRADEMDSYSRQIEEIQNRAIANSRRMMGLPVDDAPATASGGGEGRGGASPAETGAAAKAPAKGKNETAVVEKAGAAQARLFNTIGADDEVDAALIKAMIDQTTKAQEGTRLRFKLLDDVTIDSVTLPKGTYLYGTVSGFGMQRVKATVESILVGDRFIKVSLSVYDIDGMEGFYVPQSAFRDFVKNAGSRAAQQNMQFNSSGSSLNAESMALQALQNIYQSATSAVSANIRKNRARIKYNSVVYLINTGR